MIYKQIEEIASNFKSTFFSFSYALVPDELQAQQIVIDSWAVMLDIYKNKLNEYESLDSNDQRTHDLYPLEKQLKVLMFKQLYVIAIRRKNQLGKSVRASDSNCYSGFYSLGSRKRAILYLYYKEKLAVKDIALIVSIKLNQLLDDLQEAKKWLIDTNNLEVPLSNRRL